MEFCPRFIVEAEVPTAGALRDGFTVIDIELEEGELTGGLALSVVVQVTEYEPAASLKKYVFESLSNVVAPTDQW
jgi:hypothetical protein